MDAIYVPQTLKTVACALAVRLRGQGSREPTLLCPMRLCAPGAISYLGSRWRGGRSSPDLSVWCDDLGPTISPGSTLKTGQGEECATPKLPLAAPCPPPLGTTRPVYRLLPALGGSLGPMPSRAPGTRINPDFVRHPGRPRGLTGPSGQPTHASGPRRPPQGACKKQQAYRPPRSCSILNLLVSQGSEDPPRGPSQGPPGGAAGRQPSSAQGLAAHKYLP